MKRTCIVIAGLAAGLAAGVIMRLLGYGGMFG